MVGSTYELEDQTKWRENFQALLTKLNNDPEDLEFKNVLKNMTLENIEKLRSEEYENETSVKAAIADLRQQTIAYYLSTEEISTKFLNYLPVPGQYEACITVEEMGGKAWAL